MSERTVILMTSGPETPRRCASPFYLASLAAAMGHEVTMYFTIDGILLLKRGVAETVYPKAGGEPASTFIAQARSAGVQFLACTAGMDLHGVQREDLIEGVTLAGGATFLDLAQDADVTLSF